MSKSLSWRGELGNSCVLFVVYCSLWFTMTVCIFDKCDAVRVGGEGWFQLNFVYFLKTYDFQKCNRVAHIFSTICLNHIVVTKPVEQISLKPSYSVWFYESHTIKKITKSCHILKRTEIVWPFKTILFNRFEVIGKSNLKLNVSWGTNCGLRRRKPVSYNGIVFISELEFIWSSIGGSVKHEICWWFLP